MPHLYFLIRKYLQIVLEIDVPCAIFNVGVVYIACQQGDLSPFAFRNNQGDAWRSSSSDIFIYSWYWFCFSASIPGIVFEPAIWHMPKKFSSKLEVHTLTEYPLPAYFHSSWFPYAWMIFKSSSNQAHSTTLFRFLGIWLFPILNSLSPFGEKEREETLIDLSSFLMFLMRLRGWCLDS